MFSCDIARAVSRDEGEGGSAEARFPPTAGQRRFHQSTAGRELYEGQNVKGRGTGSGGL